MSWNIGDQPIIEAVITPHSSNPTGAATAVSCVFTKPDGVAGSAVTMTLTTGTWRCTGPTLDQAGHWKYKVSATAGLIGAESGTFVTVD